MSSVKRRLLTGGIVAAAGVVGVAGAAQASGDLHTAPTVSARSTAGAAAAATVFDAAAPGSPTTTGAASGATRKAGHRRAHPGSGLLGHAEYGQFLVRRHSADVTLAVQRGTLTAVIATGTGTATAAVTVRSPGGHAQVYAVTAASKLTAHGVVEPLASLRVGQRVRVLARVAGGRDTVVRLAVHPSEHHGRTRTATRSATSTT